VAGGGLFMTENEQQLSLLEFGGRASLQLWKIPAARPSSSVPQDSLASEVLV